MYKAAPFYNSFDFSGKYCKEIFNFISKFTLSMANKAAQYITKNIILQYYVMSDFQTQNMRELIDV